MTLAATLRADYAATGGRRSCELTVEGPLAMKAAVVVDRSDALVGLAVTAVFVPACRPCARTAFQACAEP